MRYTVSNSEVAHLWANQAQSEASNATGSIYFRDNTIYSYGGHFPMARHVDGIVLITNRSHSITTSKHQGLVSYACNHKTCFYVDDVEARDKREHRKNLSAMKSKYESLIIKASRARCNKEWLHREANALLYSANEYSAFFKLTTRLKPANVEQLTARDKAQRKAALLKAKKRKAELIALNAERIAAWRNGDNITLNYQLDVALRLIDNGETVQTSHGAKFPARHAVRSLPMVHKCVKHKQAWRRNGENIRLGYYHLDSIAANGDIKAGCHFVKYTEVQHLESLLNNRRC